MEKIPLGQSFTRRPTADRGACGFWVRDCISSRFEVQPPSLSSNMSDKILMQENRLVVISNENDVTMTYLTSKKPLSWIRHLGSAILNFYKSVYFIKYPKNRSYWTVKHKCLTKECLKNENTTHYLKYNAKWFSQ